jgi:antagonist of KipI
MDPRALRLSNALVGNDAEAAALEVTLIGPEVEFEDERTVAVCGAEFDLSVDRRMRTSATAFTLYAGDRMRFGARRRGARAYLAVNGGFDVPSVLGSRSTHAASRIGGYDGRPLATGDVVPLGQPTQGACRSASTHGGLGLEVGMELLPDRCARLRVLPGPQGDGFPDRALAQLQSAPFVVRPESNRMGYRLKGPLLDIARGHDRLSSPTVLGALQVPLDGQPILLMADRQATGGYLTLATVISADIGWAGQLAPGDSVSFEVCTPREALSALIAQERTLMAVESRRIHD